MKLALFENLSHLRVGTVEHTVADSHVAVVLAKLKRLKVLDIGYTPTHTLTLGGGGSGASITKKNALFKLSVLRLREAPILLHVRQSFSPPETSLLGCVLRVLELGYCKIQSGHLKALLVANSQTLVHVTAKACSRLTTLQLEGSSFPALECLDLCYCGRLKYLRLGPSPKLRVLSLKQCLALEALEVKAMSPALTELDLRVLPKLIDVQVPVPVGGDGGARNPRAVHFLCDGTPWSPNPSP